MGLTGLTYNDEWRNSKSFKVSDRLATILDTMTHNNWKKRYQDAELLFEILFD